MACCIFALAILIAPAAIAQNMVSGTVVDGQNEPVIGASVMVKGTTSGVATGIDGDFSIAAKPSDVLKVSAVGYKTAEVKVEGSAPIRITLEESSEVLDEVVVIGYGTSTKKELTGSVASMKKEELNPGTFPNAMGMLQGKVAGLQIVNPSGADPTAKYEILLRGTNTLAAGQGPLVIIDGVAGADIRNINPQDIESIDVLKDGSAAAIYGTRGTNGVIIVTTRRAREGRAEVTYEGQFTVGKVTRRAVPLTASEFNYVIDTYRPELSGSKYGADTDWFDEITRTPISHKHTLSLSGGTEKFSHFTSLNYEKAEGVQRGNDFEKIAGRTNIRQSLLEGWVDVDVNLFITHRKYNPSNTSAFQQAFIHNPTEPVYDPSNTTSGGYYRIEAMEYYNPVAMINERTSTTVNDNFGGNARVTLNIKPVKGLKWDAFLALSRESNESKTYSTHYYPSIIGTDGSAEISNYKNNDTQFETTLNYIRSFGPHSLQALLGYTYQKGTENSAGMSNVGFDFTDTLDIAARCGQDADCNPATAGGVLGVMKGYSGIPAFWLDPLKEVENLNFEGTDISLASSYQMSYNQALKLIEKNGGRVEADKVVIPIEKASVLPLEQNFTNTYPLFRERKDCFLDKEYEFSFDGNGFVIWGNICSLRHINKDYINRVSIRHIGSEVFGLAEPDDPYVADVQVWIDGKLDQTVKMPMRNTDRRVEPAWKYLLPEGPHTVRLVWTNPNQNYTIRINDIMYYSEKPNNNRFYSNLK